jgi:hypothetical protein
MGAEKLSPPAPLALDAAAPQKSVELAPWLHCQLNMDAMMPHAHDDDQPLAEPTSDLVRAHRARGYSRERRHGCRSTRITQDLIAEVSRIECEFGRSQMR